MSELSEIPVGIKHPKDYYIGGMGGIRSIKETIQWDQDIIKKVPFPQNFLLGGCATPKSLEAMLGLIEQNCSKTDTKLNLYVFDIEKIAIDKISHWLKEYHQRIPQPQVAVHIIQGDLLHLPIPDGVIDYIRLDSTQNFIQFEQQEAFLGELNRVLSKEGVISNVIQMVNHKAVNKARRTYLRGKNPYFQDNCIIREDDEYNLLILSRKKMKKTCSTVRLNCTWGKSMSNKPYHWEKLQHVILSKSHPDRNLFNNIKRQFGRKS